MRREALTPEEMRNLVDVHSLVGGNGNQTYRERSSQSRQLAQSQCVFTDMRKCVNKNKINIVRYSANTKLKRFGMW